MKILHSRSYPIAVSAITFFSLAMAATGAGEPKRVEIKDSRPVSETKKTVWQPVSDADRLGVGQNQGQAQEQSSAQGNPQIPFVWKAPKHWNEETASQFRAVNYSVGADKSVECYISILPGTGGGLLANINRWFGQMNKSPLSAEALEALPKGSLLQRPAPFVNIKGNFSSMRGGSKENWRLLGMALDGGQFLITAKMTGPAELVAKEVKNFRAFCASLKFRSSS